MAKLNQSKRITFFIILCASLMVSSGHAAEEYIYDPLDERQELGDRRPLTGLQELTPLPRTDLPQVDDKGIRIIPLVDFSAMGTFSHVNDAGSSYGFDINGLFSPVIKIDDKKYIIPYYSGSFSEVRQIVTEEEGGRLTDIISNHNTSLEYKHVANRNWIYRYKALSRVHLVKENNFDWGDGLYDYWDAGGGASVEYFFENTNTSKNSVTIGGEIYHRTYPNFQSLISLSTLTAPETNVKDYVGYRSVLRYNYRKKGFAVKAVYAPVYKDFDDKKVITSSAVLGSDTRQDWYHFASIDVTHFPENWTFGYNLLSTFQYNKSNQNFNDSLGTLGIGDDVFTSNYFSYWAFTVNPSIIIPIRLENERTAIVIVGYEYLFRNYESRNVQTGGGIYTTEKQEDQSHTIQLHTSYPITDSISAILLARYSFVSSNQEFETFYRYSYDALYAAAGLRFQY
ncbi:hypothetical protein IID04_05175 [PVC group bacterium]|nr:hypothetical protein [PVC group bacterium]